MTTEVAPRSPATRRTRSRIFRWPRCRPSKLPSARIGCDQRAGRASSGKWMMSIRTVDTKDTKDTTDLKPQVHDPCVTGGEWPSRDLQNQSIISEFHAARQARARLGMTQVV